MAQSLTRFDAVIAAPFGRVGIILRDSTLADISLLPPSSALVAAKTPAARRICAQLRQYLKNPKTHFGIELMLDGTPFQQRVWRALQRIPSGQVKTYGELAQQLKSSARAIGNACRANPIPIAVPCQRVVAVNGDGGFMDKRAGQALVFKRWLLAHERSG